jgi:uncharacterized membrane protein
MNVIFQEFIEFFGLTELHFENLQELIEWLIPAVIALVLCLAAFGIIKAIVSTLFNSKLFR